MEDLREDEEDPVVKEIDVYLSQSLAQHLYLMQYPLHPSQSPYTSANILGARVSNHGERVELDLKVRPRGENYSTSRGEHYARMVQMGMPADGQRSNQVASYESDLFDKFTLTSSTTPLQTQRYAAGTLKNGSLHLTLLRGMMQMRPSLSYLDLVDIGAKKMDTASDGGDTTESEGEEARPVMVKFAKRENVAKSQQKKVGHRISFTEKREKKSAAVWSKVTCHGSESEEAESERCLLLASHEDQRGKFDQIEEKYLDSIFPKGNRGMENGNGTSDLPIGVVSLEQIKKLPLKRQVTEVLCTAHMIQFGHLCSLLGTPSGKKGEVLEALMGCGVLVQGCWVVSSHVLYPDSGDAAKRKARDYILWCFTQKRLVPRYDIMGVVKLPNEEVRQLMQSLANQRFIPQQGWEFKLETDLEFISRNYSTVVTREEEKWKRRHAELVSEINLKSPASTKAPASIMKTPTTTTTTTTTTISTTSSSRTPSSAMDVTITPSNGGVVDSDNSEKTSSDSGQKKAKRRSKSLSSAEAKLPPTPSRHPSTSSLVPQTISMPTDAVAMTESAVSMPTGVVVKTESTITMPTGAVAMAESVVPMDIGAEATLSSGEEDFSSMIFQASSHLQVKKEKIYETMDFPVKQEKPSQELLTALSSFCREVIGEGVIKWSDLKNRLLLQQFSVKEGHPLKEQGVSNDLLEQGLRLCGAREVGQALGKRMFALSYNDQCRNVVLDLFQKHKFLRKKQVVDELEARGIQESEKGITRCLKELCHGKGGNWKLLGT